MDLFPSLFSYLYPAPPPCCCLLRWSIPIKSHSWASGSCCVCWEWPVTELLRPFQIHHTVYCRERINCCPHTLRIDGDSGRPICQVTHASIFFFLSGATRVWRCLCESASQGMRYGVFLIFIPKFIWSSITSWSWSAYEASSVPVCHFSWTISPLLKASPITHMKS